MVVFYNIDNANIVNLIIFKLTYARVLSFFLRILDNRIPMFQEINRSKVWGR